MTPTFTGEVMMAGWSDTHNGGAKVTFWLPDADSLEVFKGLTQKKGNTAGHRFMCVLVEIGDDEAPVDRLVEGPKPDFSDIRPRKVGPLCMLAVKWCRDPEFLNWLAMDSEKGAASCVKVVCGIESRKELDTDPAAAERFHSLIRGPFSKYQLARGRHENNS